MNILIILTSHDKLGDTGKKTGFWLEEFAAPYYVFLDADGFEGIFFPGGHGPLWDLAENADNQRIIERFIEQDRPLAAVCHAPAIFKHTKGADGRSLVSGRRVTAFTNTEEEAVGLTEIVPFLLEDMLKANGGLYEKGPDWGAYVVVDGNLITGQNPASSEVAARELLKLLQPLNPSSIHFCWLSTPSSVPAPPPVLAKSAVAPISSLHAPIRNSPSRLRPPHHPSG